MRDGLSEFLDGLALLAWVTDDSDELVFVNREWTDFTGASRDEIIREGLLERVLPEHRSRLRRHLLDANTQHTPFQCDFQLRRYDGQYRILSCYAGPYEDAAVDWKGVVGLCIDLTETKQREEQLAFMATHDSLTGLPNRRLFESSLSRAVSRAKRGAHASLLMIDVDNFKLYNDSRGHLEGDQALVNFAMLLQRHVRAGDLLARIGGDEFAVLLEGTTVAEATEIADRMREAAHAEEFVAGAREHHLGLSGGIVPVDGRLEARQVFDLADESMYEAKERGRNQVHVVRDRDLLATQPADRLAGRVRDAIAEQRFVLYYQPVIRLTDDTVAYFESLARMVDGGDISTPAEFLPTVERLGFMPRLTRLVVGMVVHALAENPGATISVNLSRGDLADDSLPSFVDQELRRVDVEPSRIVFEMSESAVMGNLAAARSWMERLGGLGCRFALDEFGAGLGLFGLLREVPFDQVKLDGSIVTALSADGESTAFIEAVRGLIESQGRTAVASWVEDEELLRRVVDVGFEFGQGYYLHVPTPDLKDLMRRLG